MSELNSVDHTGIDDLKQDSSSKVIEEATKSRIWYILDLLANTLYHPNGFTRPFTYWGKINTSTEFGKTQKTLFHILLDAGFQRQFFQIVFPGQVAGIVKKIESERGFDEVHIRFYKDGGIDVELEQDRFGFEHWRGKRVSGHRYLTQLLDQLDIGEGDKHYIVNHLLKDKQMHKLCELGPDNEYFNTRIAFTILWLWEYGFGTAITLFLLYLLMNNS